MLSIYGTKELKEEIMLNSHKTTVIMGEAGTGKTVAITEIAKETGKELILMRMQGIDSTDVNGIPARNEEKGFLEYLKPEEIKKIIDNSDKEYILFLDEINRAETEMEPILFQLFERKIGNKFYPNLTVVCAINHGENYNTNINFSEDKALRRRITFMDFKPNKKDIINFAKKNDYNEHIISIMETLDYSDFWSYSTKTEFEAVTTLGSFYDWNEYLKKIQKVKNLKEITIEKSIDLFSSKIKSLYFNEEIGVKIFGLLSTLKDIWKNIDLQEILETNKIPKKYEKYKEDIHFKIKDMFIENAHLEGYIQKNSKHIFKIFEFKSEYIINIVKILRDKDEEFSTNFLKELDLENKSQYNLLIEINTSSKENF